MDNQRKEISYPGILFWSGYNFYVIDNSERVTNWLGWKKGDPYIKAKMYDSSGVLWEKVTSKQQEFNFLQKLTNWSRIISLSFSSPVDTSVDVIAEELCRIVDAEWDDDVLDNFISRSKLKELFRSAKTPAELIHVAENLGADLVEG